MKPLIITALIFVFGACGTQLKCVETKPPLEISIAGDTVRSQLLWLDYGNVAAKTSKTVTLNVRNISNEAIVLDAFSWSSTVRVQWSHLSPESDLKNRIRLNPGGQDSLNIDAYFVDNDPEPKIITLMKSDSELVQIISRELVHLEPRVSKRADQSPAEFWFSGDGNSWSGWYELHLHEAPPGYALDPKSVQVQVSDIGVEGHLRRCGAWAVCEITRSDDTDVSARMSVQGHHEGGLMNTNVHLRFKAELKAEYILKQSVKLSAVSYDFIRTPAGNSQPIPHIETNRMNAVNAQFSILDLASVSEGRPDAFFASPQRAGSLDSAQPKLYHSCESSLQEKKDPTSCVELGHWVAAQTERPNHVNEAADLYAKACKSGYARGCTELGLLGKFTGDATSASDEFRHACEMGDGLACYSLAQQIGNRRDPLITQLYGKACQLHFPAPGCEQKFLTSKSRKALSR